MGNVSGNTTVTVNQVDPTLSDDMNYLHIGGLEPNLTNQKSLKADEQPQHEFHDDHEDDLPNAVSIPINVSSSVPVAIDTKKAGGSRPVSHPKVHLNAASSPPWSWQWGGLPERRNKEVEESEELRKERNLKNRSSTPLLRSGDASPLVSSGAGMITINEKVGNYLESGIPHPPDTLSIVHPHTGYFKISKLTRSVESTFTSSSTVIAVGQDVQDDQVCLSMTGAAGNSSEYIICSSCGPLADMLKLETDQVESRFSLKMLEFEDICERPDILTAPTTVYRIYGLYVFCLANL